VSSWRSGIVGDLNLDPPATLVIWFRSVTAEIGDAGIVIRDWIGVGFEPAWISEPNGLCAKSWLSSDRDIREVQGASRRIGGPHWCSTIWACNKVLRFVSEDLIERIASPHAIFLQWDSLRIFWKRPTHTPQHGWKVGWLWSCTDFEMAVQKDSKFRNSFTAMKQLQFHARRVKLHVAWTC